MKIITHQQLRALQYIKNTGGGATKENFIEDHDPIGEILWEGLEKMGLAYKGVGTGIYLTDKGIETMEHAELPHLRQ